MYTTEQARAAAELRRAEFARQARRAADHIRAITGEARAQGRDRLDLAEDQAVDTLLGRRDEYDRQARALDGQLAEYDAVLADEAAAPARFAQRFPHPAAGSVRAATRLDRPHYDQVMRVGREARTYRPDTDPHGVAFLRDVVGNFLSRDPAASERLARHVAEERVERPGAQQRAAGDSTTANWAGLTVPQYLTDMFAPSVVPLRPFADICNRSRDLPEQGMTINISLISTPSQVAVVGSELPAGGVAAGSIDDTLLTENVQTAAGQVTLSRQAIDRGTGIEEATMSDLMRQQATTLDSTLINQATVGLNALAVVNTYTDASPTVTALWPFLFKALSKCEAAVRGVAVPSHILMTPARFRWACSMLGSTWPLVGGAAGVGVQAGGLITPIGDPEHPGVRGRLSDGTPVVADASIPANLGAGTNQDRIYAIAADECWLFEDPDAPLFIRAEQPKAAQLGVLIVAYSYFAFTMRRYANAVQCIDGTGLVVPAGF